MMQIGWSRVVERRNEPVAFHRKWRSRIPRKGNPCVTKKTHQLTNTCDGRDELCETIRRLFSDHFEIHGNDHREMIGTSGGSFPGCNLNFGRFLCGKIIGTAFWLQFGVVDIVKYVDI
jgi:hypothetical protein